MSCAEKDEDMHVCTRIGQDDEKQMNNGQRHKTTINQSAIQSIHHHHTHSRHPHLTEGVEVVVLLEEDLFGVHFPQNEAE